MAQTPFITSPALVAIAVNYAGINRTARGYIADRVALRINVDGADFRYPEFPIEEAFTVYDDQIDRLGRLNEITSSSTETTGSVVDHGILEKVPFRDEMQARAGSIPFSRRSLAVRHVIDVIQKNREIRVANMTMNLSNYATGYKTDLSAGTKWSDYTNSTPLTDVKAAMRGMLIPPNVGITTQAVLDTLSLHPQLSTAAGGSAGSGRMLAKDEIARLLGLERIEIGNTLKQTSKRGQALTTGPIWTDSFAMHYQGPMDAAGMGLDANSPNFLSTFQWGGIVSGENTYRPGEMGLYGGVGVYTGESLVEKRVAPMAGYLFASVL